jgi:hypothetical protein
VELEQEKVLTQSLDSVWMIGEISKENLEPKSENCRKPKKEHAPFKCTVLTPGAAELGAAEFDELEIGGIDGNEMTREAQIEFNETDVRKPLASARFVAKAGNGIWLEENGGYIENLATGEKMAVRVVNDVYVFDVELDDESKDVITLDSGAGCSVWPKGRHSGNSKMLPNKKGVGMVAANGTPIQHYGQRKICFKGVKAAPSVFGGRM